MANLNLSQFTEKTFVADADWVFVWDTVGLISKKVSRNNWLNSGELTTSAPVTISQTWNAGAVRFTALKVNAVNTASAADSLLLDLQVGGLSYATINRFGNILTAGTIQVAGGNSFLSGTALRIGNSNGDITLSGASLLIPTATAFGWANTLLVRDGADNTLALRNGAAAQTFNVYGTYTSGSAYSRLAIACDTSGNATLTTQSTGTAGTVSINGVPVGLGKGSISNNVAIGSSALNANTTGGANISIGSESMKVNTTGFINAVVGVESFFSAVAGCSFNSVFGNVSLKWLTTGSENAVLGYNAATILASTANATSVSNSVFLGAGTRPEGNAQTNQIVIGHNTIGLGSNTAVLGNSSITTTALRGNVGIGTTAPSSKLQVTGGDVEIETVTSGIIMKAAGTSTRYRITLNAGGTALVFTAI